MNANTSTRIAAGVTAAYLLDLVRSAEAASADTARQSAAAAESPAAQGTHWSSAGVTWSSCVIARGLCAAR